MLKWAGENNDAKACHLVQLEEERRQSFQLRNKRKVIVTLRCLDDEEAYDQTTVQEAHTRRQEKLVTSCM
jgi:hypothetical protein